MVFLYEGVSLNMESPSWESIAMYMPTKVAALHVGLDKQFVAFVGLISQALCAFLVYNHLLRRHQDPEIGRRYANTCGHGDAFCRAFS
jgi:hypothetical protein